MANDKAFKVKNGILAQRYLQSAGTETAGSETYNIPSASYDDKTFVTTSQDTTLRGITFKPDGLSLYTTGTANNTIYQYTLSTAWDVSTASYASKSLSITSQSNFPNDLVFKTDGSELYVADYGIGSILQYSLSTAWDVSTGSYTRSFSVASLGTNSGGLEFRPDGTKMYVAISASSTVYQYSLSTPWNISTASYDSVSLTVSSGSATSVSFKSDGLTLFVNDSVSDIIAVYPLSTAWDLSTASTSSGSFNNSTQTVNVAGLFVSADGYKMYLSDYNNDTIYQYSTGNLTQTLDLSTGTYFSFTPSGATTVSFSNPPASGLATGFTVEVNGDGSVITWPISVKWHEATTPTATATKELYTFITTDGGTTYIGKKAAGELA